MIFQALLVGLAAAAPVALADADICALPVVVGPGRAALPRFAFDPKTGTCKGFLYGGSEGNANNFETLEECEAACAAAPPPEAGICALPVVPGPCEAFIPRFAFDAQTGACDKFIYGGCFGNANNFETLEECEAACAAPPPPPPPEFSICNLRIDPGPCSARDLRRWGHSAGLGRCVPFTYGGCGGNANNFHTSQECQEACP